MLIAKPAPEARIRELVNSMFCDHPEVAVDSFLIPRHENCNFQWNVISTGAGPASFLEWYWSKVAESEGYSLNDRVARQSTIEELLEDVIGDPRYSVVVEGCRAPLTVEYLLDRQNWISNAASIAVYEALIARFDLDHSDIDAATGQNNPWFEPAWFTLEHTQQGMGIIQKLASLMGGPRRVYGNLAAITPFFNRTKLYELIEDVPLSRTRRRVIYQVHWTNYYYVIPGIAGWNHAMYSFVPLLFSRHAILKHVPGFSLGLANVTFEFPDGDYAGTWVVSVEYEITPIDRVRSWLNVGELQTTVAALSAEVLELQRDRKALTEEAEQLAGQLIEAEKLAAVGRLSFGVGHDLRNTLATAINSGIPLSRLMADLQQVMGMLEQEKPVEEIAEYMSKRKIHLRLGNAPDLYETMMSSLAQALENVKALEGYAVQDGSDFQEMRIEEVIERVFGDHCDDLSGIQVETSFADREYVFEGNPLKIYDVFQNLVLNAIEAMEETEEPVLKITTEVREGMHQTVVEDNGCGMSEEVMKHAFEPFFTTRELAGGRQRGLGLFNVWRLVEQHGGAIQVDSESGQRTRFVVSFTLSE